MKDLLRKAFEAGEDYSNSGEFAYYAPDFEQWFKSVGSDELTLTVNFNGSNEIIKPPLVTTYFTTEH